MRLIAPILAVLALACAAGADVTAKTDGTVKSDDAIKKEMAALEGEWSMVSGEADGQAMPEGFVKTGKRVAEGGRTTISIGDRVLFKAKFGIDPGKAPKSIDYEMTEGTTKGKTHLGIYELEGDTVKFCFAAPGDERPAVNSAGQGSRRTLSVWKRSKK